MEQLTLEAGHVFAESAVLLSAKMCSDAKMLMRQAINHALNDPACIEFMNSEIDGKQLLT